MTEVRRDLIIVFLSEGGRKERGGVANSVCDVGIDHQPHRRGGGT